GSGMSAANIIENYVHFDPKQARCGNLAGSNATNDTAGPLQDAIVFVVGGGNYIEYQNLAESAHNSTSSKSIMDNSDMELDPVDTSPQQQQQPQTRGVPFTPPHSTDHTPQRMSAVGEAGNIQGFRAGDSAAPESPVATREEFDFEDGDFEYGVDDMEFEQQEQQQQQQQGYASHGASRKSRNDYGIPDDESTKLVHEGFFNKFSKNWMSLS
ncbi:Vesicle trafficking between the ER and Golgi, partial [Coemansia interrupta]